MGAYCNPYGFRRDSPQIQVASKHDHVDVDHCRCVSLFVYPISESPKRPHSSLQCKTSLQIKSPLCPPVNKNDTASPVEDQDDPPAISMESYWRSMDEVKHEAEEELKEKEKHDIGDVVKRIHESVAVKSAEAHRLEREHMEENQ